MIIKRALHLTLFLLYFFQIAAQNIDQKIEYLIQEMTLEEKIGQLNHLKGEYSTDNYEQNVELFSEIKKGRVGALTAWAEMPKLIAWQKAAIDSSRLGIPLLYSADIIHGYRTIFPINIGQAASFDLHAIEESERIAAIEATASGITWNFAPMVDISRDARWGLYQDICHRAARRTKILR